MATADFFVDANVIIYAAGPGEQQEGCLEILRGIAAGDAAGRTSSAALEEVWHAELRGRIAGLRGVTERALALFTPLLLVTDQAFSFALQVQAPASLGANDRVHVGTCLAHGIDYIVSADASFDSVPGIRRIDPADAGARQRLLQGTLP